MKIIPRDYQQTAVMSIDAYYGAGNTGNPVIAMPTGTGKSVVIAGFLKWVYSQWPNQRIMVITHVKELIGQNYAKLMTMWVNAPAGIYSSGLGRRETLQKITFAGIASVVKRYKEFGHIDLIIVDECHMINPTEEGNYGKFINGLKLRNPYVKVIGLTATPYRLGHGKITEGGLFTDVCCDMTTMEFFNWFIQEGYLVPLIPRPTKTILDVSGVGRRGGEFIASELQTAVDKKHITNQAMDEAIEMGQGRKRWLIFASGIEHANNCAMVLSQKGVICKAVHSYMPDKERDDVIKWFLEESEEVRAVSNNGVLTTGFDHPAIDLILMLRPTSSPVLWVQMLGRGTRPFFMGNYDLSTRDGRLASILASPKQNCLVLDYAGNTRRIGPVNDPVLPRKKGQGGGEPPVKECEVCTTLNHISARVCISCGSTFTFQTKLKAAASTTALIKSCEPLVEVLEVDEVHYDIHRKAGAPDSLKVSYYCGYSTFREWVCLDHTNFAGVKAREWMAKRGVKDIIAPAGMEESTKVELALQFVGTLPQPTHLRVWTNKQYPEIMATCFDGTAFNTITAVPKEIPVEVLGRPTNEPKTLEEAFDAPPKANFALMDDDIPF